MGMVDKQHKFSQMVACLLLQADRLGYQITLGDAYRDPDVKYGHPRSLHKKRLAIDVNLFKDGKYLDKSEDHLALGEYWESIGGVWGGRWKNRDGNHYQLGHIEES